MAAPTVAANTVTKTELNGDFAHLGSDGRPDGWRFSNSTPLAKRQWAVVSDAAPPASTSGRSLRCEMVGVPCSLKNGVRWANNRAVPRVQHQGACEGEVATSPLLAVTGGSIVQVTLWARMTNHSLPPGQAPQMTAITYNEKGGYCLDAFYSGAGSILYTWEDLSPSWDQYSVTITLPENATHLSLENSLRCYGCKAGEPLTATWEIADVSVTRLDLSLRNVIRTNATDIEVVSSPERDGGPAVRYAEGVDYTVEAPRMADSSRTLNTSVLDPYDPLHDRSFTHLFLLAAFHSKSIRL